MSDSSPPQQHPENPQTKISKSGLWFSYDEDMQLCKSYLDISSRPITTTVWEDVKAHYDTHIDPAKKKKERSADSLCQRYSTINASVSEYNYYYELVKSRRKSDHVQTTHNYIEEAVEAEKLYIDRTKSGRKRFKLDHCWYFLHNDKRWRPKIEFDKEQQSTSTPDSLQVCSSSDPSPRSSIPIDSLSSELSSNSSPIEAVSSISSSARKVTSASDSSSRSKKSKARSKKSAKTNDTLRELEIVNDRILTTFRDIIDARFMSMDASTITCEKRRKYYELRQESILKRCKLA